MSRGTVPELLDEVVKTYSDRAAYRYKQDGRWIDISWSECRERVWRISRGDRGFRGTPRLGLPGPPRFNLQSPAAHGLLLLRTHRVRGREELPPRRSGHGGP